MEILLWIIAATFLDGVVALIGALTLVFSDKTMKKLIFPLVAFSSGALLSGAFFHMTAESLEHLSSNYTFGLLLVGFSTFYLLERILRWHHCHEEKCEVHSFTYMILFGDAIHNFIDGLVIGASFLISVPFGVITTLLIIIHEIPQELGDFGVLVYGGFKPTSALLWNFVSQLTCVLGGVSVFFLSGLTSLKFYLLPLAAGGFIYIAASDLIPELHKENNIGRSIIAFALFAFGVGLIVLFKTIGG